MFANVIAHLALVLGAVLVVGCQAGTDEHPPDQVVLASAVSTARTGVTSWAVYHEGQGSMHVLGATSQHAIVAEATIEAEGTGADGSIRVTGMSPDPGFIVYTPTGGVLDVSDERTDWMEAMLVDLAPPAGTIAYSIGGCDFICQLLGGPCGQAKRNAVTACGIIGLTCIAFPGACLEILDFAGDYCVGTIQHAWQVCR
jgi:hypothetical protein